MKRPASLSLPAELPDASMSEFDGTRYLHLGETPWVQGAMRIRQPRLLVLEYIQRMMAGLLWLPLDRWDGARVTQLGLGAASLTRFTHQVMHLPTTVVELNPQVIGACRQWFKLPADDDLLQVHNADAADWVADPAHARSAELLQIDLYDHEAAAPVLDSAAFYAQCRELLAPGGVLAVNLFGRDASFARSTARLAEAFGAAQVRRFGATREGNTIVLARRASGDPLEDAWPPRAELLARAEHIETTWKLPATKWLRSLKAVKPATADAAPAPVDALA
jgi:spermidine synthase